MITEANHTVFSPQGALHEASAFMQRHFRNGFDTV